MSKPPKLRSRRIQPPSQPSPKHLKSPGRDRHIGWALDFDYLDKLDANTAKWLAEFVQEYYRSGSRRHQTVEQVRERWRAYKASQVDLVSGGDGLGKRADGRELDHDEDDSHANEEDKAIARLDRKRGNGGGKPD